MGKDENSLELVIVIGESEKDRSELWSEMKRIISPDLEVEKISEGSAGTGASYGVFDILLKFALPVLSGINAFFGIGERLKNLMQLLKKKGEIFYLPPKAFEYVCCFDLLGQGIRAKEVLCNLDLTIAAMKMCEDESGAPRTGRTPRTYMIVIRAEDERIFQYVIGDQGEVFLYQELPIKSKDHFHKVPKHKLIYVPALEA